ncbi:MAG: EscU/YscU/HrcU family type III secretion system export apparatus switch protein, partial [Treponemataceae bacterium]|nr:EscU/YscU/HrcU family type III secretion system export apparatus switch protein [Treponemataceae bacterium]
MKKAVALKYPEGASAPFIAASAKGFLAQKMLEVAAEKKIPITEDAALADFLSVQEIGQAIPEETWEALEKIFAFVVQYTTKAFSYPHLT